MSTGSSDTTAQLADNLLAVPVSNQVIGYVSPIVGREARRDVLGYFGFPLIRAGQQVTAAHVAKAENMGRLFELISSTEAE